MDYFSPRTPAPRTGESYADPALHNDAGSPSYFGPAATAVADSEANPGDPSSSAAPTATENGPLPTPNPFKLADAQPTAFPVQNGATMGFQQALLQRQGSSVTTGQLTTALPTPHARRQQRAAVGGGISSSKSGMHGAFGAPSSRLAAPPSLGKSPRTPSISSPRKMESVSPPSSPDQHHSSPRKVPAGSSVSASEVRNPFEQPSSNNAFQAALQSRLPLQTPSLKLPSFANKGPSSTSTGAAALPSPASGLGLRRGAFAAKTAGSSVCAPTSSVAARRGAAVQNPRFKAISVPVDLARILSEDAGTPHSDGNLQDEGDAHARNKKLLIMDMRPHTSFVTQGRFKGAINVCVPSTLLRRPNFGLQKIADTLGSKTDKDHFMRALGLEPQPANLAKVNRILLLDQDLGVLTADSVIHSLLAKIEKCPFRGDLYWLQGGWNLTDKCVDSPAQVAKSPEEIEAANVLEQYIDWSLAHDESGSEDESMDVEEAPSVANAFDQPTPQERSHSLSIPVQGANQGAPIARSSSGSGSGGSIASSSASSLFASSFASSTTSMDAQSSSKTPLSSFDSSKMQLPDLRNTSSPAESSVSPTPGQAGGSQPKRSASGSAASSTSTKAPVIRPGRLPMSAFQFGSTAAGASAAHGKKSRRGSVSDGSRPSSAGGRDALPSQTLTKLATGNSPPCVESKEEYGASAARGKRNAVQKKAAANPFFDNIRQNVESTSLKETLAHVKPFHLPEEYVRPALLPRLPSFLQRLSQLSPQSRSEQLHREYFELEQQEQKRIQKVLDWHCEQSAVVEIERPDGSKVASDDNNESDDARDQSKGSMKLDGYHPFSISAGVEKGHLNRYKNIWPYEHARVRVKKLNSPTSGDYINASHIQLRGSDKSYIASQGPLESTTEHFWKLVLQENVNVIVMLTLLAEGGRDKCSNYFRTANHGSISIRLVEEKGDTDAVKASTNQEVGFFTQDDTNTADDLLKHHKSSGNFAIPGKQDYKPRLDETTVRRTLHILDRSNPQQKEPKTVRHIQYIRWPDFDIPPDTDCLLELIRETSRAQDDLHAGKTPVLVHCSAGVGRTGTFIAVDTLLDRYRQERRDKAQQRSRGSPDSMQVDAEPGPPRSTSRSRRTVSNASASERILNMTLESDSEGSPVPQSNPTFASSTSQTKKDQANSNTPGALVEHLNRKGLQKEDLTDPVKSLVDQMREQRMNSVANAGQYLFTHLALYAGIIADLKNEGVDLDA